MKKLKIKFWQIENVVLMKVLDQDKKLRNKGKIFINNSLDITICSSDYPAISPKCIFIRGNVRERDNEVSCLRLDSTEDATTYIEKCQELISDYNISLGGEEEMVKTFVFE